MIKLFQYADCQYCAKVRAKLDELKIPYEKIEVDYANKPKEVLSVGNTVPVIQDGDLIMNESREIIKYLEEKYSA